MSDSTQVVKREGGEELTVIGAKVRFLCKGDRTAGAWSLLECEVPKGTGPGPRHHTWDEAYYVVEGVVRFVADGKEVVMKPGDFLHVTGNTVHSFSGVSD